MTRADDPDREIARELRLRGDPPVVARLSRRSLALLAGVGALALAAVVGWSVTDQPRERVVVEEAPPPAAAPPPAELAGLPKDYVRPPADAPELGPPLPGDLGRSILSAGVQAEPAPSSGNKPNQRVEDPRVQQVQLELRQARSSRLAVQVGQPAAPLSAAPGPVAPESGSTVAADTSAVASPIQPPTPSSKYVLQAGSVIRAALITGIRSDLPGQVTAQVTEDVFDSVTGRWKLIPQGARLIGAYDHRVSFGQSRVQLAWTRLLLPDGRSVELEREPATDAQGFVGLQDGVDRHWRRLLGASLISTLLGVGAQAGAGGGDSLLLQSLRMGAASTANQVGQQFVGKSLDVQPSLTIQPGVPVRVLVTKDLVMEPWPS